MLFKTPKFIFSRKVLLLSHYGSGFQASSNVIQCGNCTATSALIRRVKNLFTISDREQHNFNFLCLTILDRD